jgi:glycine cleavage system aminomethyltransferase T
MTAIRHTAIFHILREAGASLTEHHGWQVPAYFAGAQVEAENLARSAALADVSWMIKLDLKGDSLEMTPVIPDGRVWGLGRQHYLVTCEPAASVAVSAQIRSGSPASTGLPQRFHITDVTSVYAQFLLAGPRSVDILRKLTSLNVVALQNFACGQASLAHVHSAVLRDDLGKIPAFHILVSREYGESVWHSILHAGHEFQLSPFGLQALQLVGGGAC